MRKSIGMTIEKAKEILSKNKLHLDNAGLEYLPIETVEIDAFFPDEGTESWTETIHLLGVVGKQNNISGSNYYPKGDYVCRSFFVNIWHDYYYRDFFYEAMEVVEALKLLNFK